MSIIRMGRGKDKGKAREKQGKNKGKTRNTIADTPCNWREKGENEQEENNS